MSMNPDTFEDDLRALKRRALPAHWRSEILRNAEAATERVRTPRWLIAGWSVAWAAILVLHLTTPVDTETALRSDHPAPVMHLDERAALIDSLLASN